MRGSLQGECHSTANLRLPTRPPACPPAHLPAHPPTLCSAMRSSISAIPLLASVRSASPAAQRSTAQRHRNNSCPRLSAARWLACLFAGWLAGWKAGVSHLQRHSTASSRPLPLTCSQLRHARLQQVPAHRRGQEGRPGWWAAGRAGTSEGRLRVTTWAPHQKALLPAWLRHHPPFPRHPAQPPPTRGVLRVVLHRGAPSAAPEAPRGS